MRTARIARPKLRLLLALLLLAFPLGAAIWAVGDYAADSERNRIDSQLSGQLNVSVSEAQQIATAARQGAKTLGNQPKVQAAMASRDPAALAAVRRQSPQALFLLTPTGLNRVRAQRAILGEAEVVDRQRERLGWVVIPVPLDDALLADFAHKAGVTGDDRLVYLDAKAAKGRGAGTPFDFDLDGTRYRALANGPLDQNPETWLAALTPASAVTAAARDIRIKVLLAGILTILSVLLIAYVFAPAIGRGRIAQQQRATAGRVLSNVGDGIFLVDESGAITFWNPAASLITGLAESDVRGRSAEEVIPGWAAVAPLIPVVESQAHERPHAETVPLSFPDNELWISVSGVSFEEGTVYAFRDLTEERRLEEVRTDFVATVSHELRTPLASIHGAAVTLQRHREGLSETMREQLLAVVSEESERLARLVEQILLASQLSSGRLTIASESFDAGALAREVVDAARLRISDRHRIELSVDPELDLVSGNTDKARQVLTNLIENAIKYSPDGGVVQVALSAADGRARFDVRDEGLGIPEKEQERVFEKFYRLDPQLKLGIGGSGLGLYICRELVQQMNGRLWVESNQESGSTFSFELPLAEPLATPELAATSGSRL